MAEKIAALSDKELLAQLVGRQAVLQYRGSLRAFFKTEGGSHPNWLAARELLWRWLHEEMHRECLLNSPGTVRDYLRLQFDGKEHEIFLVLFLDAQHRLIVAEELFRGTLTQTSVYPREVVKAALKHNAAAVILAHNHPSGVAEPSQSDESLTLSLKQTLALIDVRVLDHFVVAGSSIVSFAEKGVL